MSDFLLLFSLLLLFCIISIDSFNPIKNGDLDTFDNHSDDDKECLGNRMEALEAGRQCLRRCRKDVPCENTRKQCLCDGLCGFSCIKPDLSCPDLRKLENGNISTNITLFNTKVVCSCDPGYYLFGSRERLCQGDEDWSGSPAECLAERKSALSAIYVYHSNKRN